MKCAFWASLLLAAAAACHDSTSPAGPWLLVEPTNALYRPGDTVAVNVRNVGQDGVGLLTCDWTIQRMDATRWTDLGVLPSVANCGDGRLLIETGVTYLLHPIAPLPASFAAGTYRYGIPDARSEADRAQLPAASRVSAPFLVQP